MKSVTGLGSAHLARTEPIEVAFVDSNSAEAAGQTPLTRAPKFEGRGCVRDFIAYLIDDTRSTSELAAISCGLYVPLAATRTDG